MEDVDLASMYTTSRDFLPAAGLTSSARPLTAERLSRAHTVTHAMFALLLILSHPEAFTVVLSAAFVLQLQLLSQSALDSKGYFIYQSANSTERKGV